MWKSTTQNCFPPPPKYAVFERIVVYVSYYSEVLSKYAKKIRGSEKSEVLNWKSLKVPLIYLCEPDLQTVYEPNKVENLVDKIRE